MIAYIRQYIVEFFEGSDVKLNITFPEDIIDRNVNPELRRNLFLIIKEAINNILKHSNATTVHVGFEINGDTYQIIMDDNGIGIDENNTSAFANGIKNMKQRAESINGILIIESSKENGTKITIKGRIN